MLRPFIARLSTETAVFLLFGFFVASLFVSGCIQTFTSASRRYRFHCRQPLRHSLSPITAFSFSHFCFSRRRLAIQSFTSPSCRRCRLLSRFVVSSSASHSFTSACRLTILIQHLQDDTIKLENMLNQTPLTEQ